MVDDTSMSLSYVLFNKGNIEATNFENLCLLFEYVHFDLSLRRDWFCGVTWEKIYIMRRVLKCEFAYDRVWLSWGDPVRFLQDISIQLLTI